MDEFLQNLNINTHKILHQIIIHIIWNRDGGWDSTGKCTEILSRFNCNSIFMQIPDNK